MRDTLSTTYDTPNHQAQHDLVTWSPVRSARAGACDECVAQLWEQSLTEGPARARTSRRVRAARLFLCHPHAQLWKDRDRDE